MYKHEWNRAMRIAASVGDVMLIGLFMAYGADDIVGAIAVGNDSLFEHFASVDPDIKNTALIKFARTGQLENVHRCMRQGAVNISEAIAAAESSGHNNVAEFLRSYMA